jgi:hypothetical protein
LRWGCVDFTYFFIDQEEHNGADGEGFDFIGSLLYAVLNIGLFRDNKVFIFPT